MTQTSHGWHINGTSFEDEPYPRDNSRRKNCKGPKRCSECRSDIHKHWGGSQQEPKRTAKDVPEGYVDYFKLGAN